jgi:hypothetical protein
MSGEGGDEDFTEGLVGVSEYEAPAPSKKSFFPWHKPRKQFVRKEQWCEQICRLLDECGDLQLDSNTLTYCGLPGSDLLDLRCFHDTICSPRGLKLRFLGFNSAAAPRSSEQIELNISLDEVIKLPQVDPRSEVIGDDIRAVANAESFAWAKVAVFGPFDVVNLDLCDSFGAEEAGLFNENYYNAVAQLMAIQARKKTPWLLLLTTRVGNGHVHAETLKRFQEIYQKNLLDCATFQQESETAFKIGDEAALTAAIASATGMHCVFLTGVCKWLMGIALGHHSSLEVKSVLGYRVEKDAPETDLVSLAIRFTPHPIPANDPASLVTVKNKLPDECALAVQALKRVSKHLDVDALLAAKGEIRADMTEQMSGLLEMARYDVAAYTEWAAAES